MFCVCVICVIVSVYVCVCQMCACVHMKAEYAGFPGAGTCGGPAVGIRNQVSPL